jgi:hypothetical protein
MCMAVLSDCNTESKYINFIPKGTLTGSTGKAFEEFGACLLSC